MDVVVCLPVLVLIAPLLLLIAVCIRLESRGPAFYSQERVGAGGNLFRILKFRSMVVDADRVGPAVSGRCDPRITRLGAFLRATKLDELPQILNVVRGEMSLIGPRAEVPRYVAVYTEEQKETLLVRPGLTGPGQVYFTLHQAGELDQVEDPDAWYCEHQLPAKLALDLDYLRRRSLGKDLAILMSTLVTLTGIRSGVAS